MSEKQKEIKELDQQAKQVVEQYKKCERKLLQLIIELDLIKAYYHFGYNSLFSYVTDRLGLTSAVAYNFIGVARKSKKVPELKREVLKGNISISKARKIVSVINTSNSKLWLRLAKEKTQKQLEREVVLADPQQSVSERVNFVRPEKEVREKIKISSNVARIQLQLGVSEKLMLKLRRAQDLEAQRSKKPVSLEVTLNEVLDVFLSKRDPIKKAQRQKIRGMLGRKTQGKLRRDNHGTINRGNVKSSKLSIEQLFSEQSTGFVAQKPAKSHKRLPIPASIQHQIQLRDNGKCTFKDKNGKKCKASRFLEFHHIQPVQNGGTNEIENLRLLCNGHHKVIHLKS